MNDFEREVWLTDLYINDRGIPVDVNMAKGALKLWKTERARIIEELRETTGLEKITRGPFLEWLKVHGCDIDDTKAATIKAEIEEFNLTLVNRALRLWSQKEVRAIDKFKTLISCAQEGRIHGVFQYGGASRTLRWAGRTFQPHNLKRTLVPVDEIDPLAEMIDTGDIGPIKLFWPDIPVSELLGSSVRHAIKATPGKRLVVADLASIESRVLAWLTGCSPMIQIFKDGRDTYKDFASRYFHVAYENVTPEQRKFSKPPVLGAGFGLGWRGMIAYAQGYGISLEEEEAQTVVDTFRKGYPEVPQFWYGLESAVQNVTTYKRASIIQGLRISLEDEFLTIKLPSGRKLWYFKPEIGLHETPWGEMKMTFSYMGLNLAHQWTRIYATGAKLTENVVQAIARDHLAHGMILAAGKNLEIVLHVHDEIAIEVDKHDSERALKQLIQCMTTNPEWDDEIILEAEGYIAKRYRKN